MEAYVRLVTLVPQPWMSRKKHSARSLRRARGSAVAVVAVALPALALAVAAVCAASAFHPVGTRVSIAFAHGGRALAPAGAHEQSSEIAPAKPAAIARRDALALASSALTIIPLQASAIQDAVPASAVEAPAAAGGARAQRLMIGVKDEDSLKREVKFWKDAMLMKVQKDEKAGDKSRAVLAYTPEEGGFSLELRVDPRLKNYLPKFLDVDYDPMVDSLNFVEINMPGKVKDVFARVQKAEGNSLTGDATKFLDVESPRGVQVRIVTRDVPQKVELIALNIEVPAFEATKLREGDPKLQPFSEVFSFGEGPKLAMTPMTDARVRERELDAFEGLVLSVSSPSETVAAAEKAVSLGVKEQKIRDAAADPKAIEKEIKRMRGREPTRSSPAVKLDGDKAVIDDGVGYLLLALPRSAFQA